MNFLVIFAHMAVFWLLQSIGIEGMKLANTCDSPQYLELGKRSTIKCYFRENFFGIFWYNTTEYIETIPILHFQDSIKYGPGYQSGEFDVHPNGSLIINEVSLHHESTFVVVYVHSQKEDPIVMDIEVILIVKPLLPYPVFRHCDNQGHICYTTLSEPSLLCHVDNARPNVTLTMVVRGAEGDKPIPHHNIISSNGVAFTSQVITKDAFYYSPLLVLVVCKAVSPPGILNYNEALNLVQNSHFDLPNEIISISHVERFTRLNLSCTQEHMTFIVWKKHISEDRTMNKVLIYSVDIGEGNRQIHREEFSLGRNGSLISYSTDVSQEGIYYCIYGDGSTDGVTFHKVSVFVYPVPNHVVIQGCSDSHNCKLESGAEGNLTCAVKGIRPLVQLEWRAVHAKDESFISFINHRTLLKDNGPTLDVYLTTTYQVKDDSPKRLTLQCKVKEEENEHFHSLMTKVDLLFVREVSNHPTAAINSAKQWLFLLLSIPVIFIAIVTGKYACRRCKFTQNVEEPEEMAPMVKRNSKDVLKETKDSFLKQIKETYKEQYNKVQPIPYQIHTVYSVNDVFIEGGIEFLEQQYGRQREKWVTLNKSEDVFTDQRVISTRIILEGEPGYGKSLVSLKFAYDWCNHTPESYWSGVDIFILLQLRKLSSASSIYSSIKSCILPVESKLSEEDIERVLLSSKTVVMVLDGFDEYSDCYNNASDIVKIISRKMFQDFTVVLTTRTNFLPTHYSALTKRVRLTGFDDNARKSYINTFVRNGDNEMSEKLIRHLAENPTLGDLCQVPLFFVMYAHMTYKSENSPILNSATTFFAYVVSCVNTHFTNKKMQDKNDVSRRVQDTDHHVLEKLAFQTVRENQGNAIWTKEDISQRVGLSLYKHYVQTGILVEESKLQVTNPSSPLETNVHNETCVRFFHKLFCEWFVAHYLRKHIEENLNDDLNDVFQNMDPADLQYTYRFTCGLSFDSAKRIIPYLMSIEDGHKYATLCVLEQVHNTSVIQDIVRLFCKTSVLISSHDSLLLQRSYVHLLNIAAKNNITIDYVYLHNCVKAIDLSLSVPVIRTYSGLEIPSSMPIAALSIWLSNREMTKKEVLDILNYATKCPALTYLCFDSCIPPHSLEVGIRTLSSLKSNRVRVRWWLFMGETIYNLNLETGFLEEKNTKKQPTEADLNNMREKMSRIVASTTEEDHNLHVKAGRERIRKKAKVKRNPTEM